jgi:cbb3-type cytochrome c oxidase subunit III
MKKSLLAITLLSTVIVAGDINNGKKIFSQNCAVCHGEYGNGLNMSFDVNPRNLTKSLLKKEQMIKVITDGAVEYGALTHEMRAFKGELSTKQIDDVAEYVSSTLSKKSYDESINLMFKSDLIPESKKEKMEKWGKKIFKRNCAFCHGPKGLGDGIATRNPEKSIFPYDLSKTILSEDQMFLYIKYGGKHWGTARGDMPAWSKKYNDFKLKSVSQYVEKYIKNKEK